MSQEGGALAEMMLPSKLGVGGPLGGGAQVRQPPAVNTCTSMSAQKAWQLSV